MTEILHGVLSGETYLNTIVPSATLDMMYPVWAEPVEAGVYIAGEVEVGGVTMQPFNSVLRFAEFPEPNVIYRETESNEVNIMETPDYVGISGNTVTRLCPVAKDCGNCALAGSGLTIPEMFERNCARANTAVAFEAMEVEGASRFMLLPTNTDTYIVGSDVLTVENNGDQIMQARLKPAESVIFTGTWLREQGLDKFAVAMNGADGSFGIATMEILGERIFIPFCSMRGNMGDRGEEAHILRRAISRYLDSIEISEIERSQILEHLSVSILIGASATLRNFGHKIQIPEQGSKYYEELANKYPELIKKAGNKITSAIVLNDQYPGAFVRHSIYPEYEAINGIHTSPITPDNCPGDGQTCHVDYRAETSYALVGQLVAMGIQRENINYDDSQAMDPADPTNIMASNRAEQNNGIKKPNTNRTINGIVVRL